MPPAPRGPGPWFLDFGLNTRVPFRFFHFYLVKNRIVQQPSLFMFIFHSFSLFFFSCYCLSAVTDQQVEACEKRMFLFIS